jgi:hypothetical protein
MTLPVLVSALFLCGILGLILLAQWRRPALCIVPLLLMFPLEQWAHSAIPALALQRNLINVVIGVLVLVGVLVRAVRGQRVLAEYPITGYLTLALFVYTLISAFWAPAASGSLRVWSLTWPYIVTTVVLAPLTFGQKRDMSDILDGLALVGGVLVALLLFSTEWKARWIVIGGEYGNPLAIGYLGGVVAIVLLLGNLWAKSRFWAIARWILAALSLALIVRSGSRGQLLALLLVVLVVWPKSHGSRENRRRLVWGLTLAFAVGVAYLAVQEFWGTDAGGSTRWEDRMIRQDLEGRIDGAITLLRTWAGSPLTLFFGLGSSASFDPDILGFYPHILPLEILGEEGIVGFTLFGLAVFYTMRSASRLLHATRDLPQERATIATLFGLYLYAVLLSLKEGALLGTHDLFLYAILIGKYDIFFHRQGAPSGGMHRHGQVEMRYQPDKVRYG